MISMNTPKKDVHAIVEEYRDSGFRDAFPLSDGGTYKGSDASVLLRF